MAIFMMVTGAWHGGWCWERLTPLMVAQGHSVHTPHLIGMSPDAPGSDDPRFLSDPLALWADQIATLITDCTAPVVLVGHSRGGAVISQIAERVPEKIAKLVYLAAFLLPDGAAIGATAATVAGGVTPDVLERCGEGLVRIKQGISEQLFYTHVAPQWQRRAIARLVPEPLASLATPLRLPSGAKGQASAAATIPRVYIECSDDQAIPIILQRQMHQALPCASVISLDSDHSPFYSQPEALAGVLDGILE